MTRQTSGRPIIGQRPKARKRQVLTPALEPRGSVSVIARGPSEDILSFFRHSGMVSLTDQAASAVMELAGDSPRAGQELILGFADLVADMSDTDLVRAMKVPGRTELWTIAELLAYYEPGDQAALLADEVNIFHVGRYTFTLRWKGDDRLFALEATPRGIRQFRRGSRVFAPL